MNIYLPPSKTQPTEEQITRFNVLFRRVHVRLKPGTPAEYSLCNEIVVGLWHRRQFRATARSLDRQMKQPQLPSGSHTELRKQMLSAFRHSKLQRNYVRRRGTRFFELKAARENQVRLPMAA